MIYQEILVQLISNTLVLPLANDGLTQDQIKREIAELAYAMSLSNVSDDTVKTFSLIIDHGFKLHMHGPATEETMSILQNYSAIRRGIIEMP